MRKDEKNIIIVIIVIFSSFFGGLVGSIMYSDVENPFSVVISQSMQHDDEKSQLGSIDTGDMIYTINKRRVEIEPYIEGYSTGKKTFKDYGNVVIFNTACDINIVHRLILFLEIFEKNGKKFVKIPHLESYPHVTLNEEDTFDKITKNFVFKKVNSEKNI